MESREATAVLLVALAAIELAKPSLLEWAHPSDGEMILLIKDICACLVCIVILISKSSGFVIFQTFSTLQPSYLGIALLFRVARAAALQVKPQISGVFVSPLVVIFSYLILNHQYQVKQIGIITGTTLLSLLLLWRQYGLDLVIITSAIVCILLSSLGIVLTEKILTKNIENFFLHFFHFKFATAIWGSVALVLFETGTSQRVVTDIKILMVIIIFSISGLLSFAVTRYSGAVSKVMIEIACVAMTNGIFRFTNLLHSVISIGVIGLVVFFHFEGAKKKSEYSHISDDDIELNNVIAAFQRKQSRE